MKFTKSALALFFVVAMACGADGALAQTNAISSAVLPTSRAGQAGTPITVFASIINAGPSMAQNCYVELESDTNNGGPNPTGLTLAYQAFEADNVTPTTLPNSPVNIDVGNSQAYVLELNATEVFYNQPIYFRFICDGGGTEAPVFDGVNTLLLTQAALPVPDIITIATSPTSDGIIRIPSLGAGEIMAVAALNIGAASSPAIVGKKPQAGANETDVVAMPEFGALDLPLDTYVCESDPATAMCLPTSPYGGFVLTQIGDQPSTFNVFTNSTQNAGVPVFADIARQNLRFYENLAVAVDKPQTTAKPSALALGNVFGATGLAVTSPGPAIGETDFQPDGIWQIQYDGQDGSIWRGGLGISVEGEWISIVRRVELDGGEGETVFHFGFMYGDNLASPDPTMTINVSRFSTPAGTDQQTEEPLEGTGTWRPRNFLNGNLGPVSMDAPDGMPMAPATSTMENLRAVYDAQLYDRTVTLASLAGNYDVIDTNDGITAVDIGNMTFLDDGSFSGTVSPETGVNCDLSGSMIGYGNGKNLLSTSFDISNCALAGFYQGMSYQDDDASLSANDVIFMFFRSFNGNGDIATYIRLVPQGTIVK